jgi:hypothetical protein
MSSINRPTKPNHWRQISGIVLSVIILLIAFDFIVGTYQAHILATRQAAQAQLEKKAWFYVRADLDQVVYTTDGDYKITLWLENLFPEYDIFLMIPPVRIFIQVGTQWQEVAATEATTDLHFQQGTVINLKDKITVDWIVKHPDLQVDYFELLQGYMHIQIHNNMFISTEAEPAEHIVERNDYYYIHLKPITTDDNQLRQLHNFPGEVPVFIPMPPH